MSKRMLTLVCALLSLAMLFTCLPIATAAQEEKVYKDYDKVVSYNLAEQALRKPLHTVFMALDTMLCGDFGNSGGRSVQAAFVEKLLGLILSGKFKTADDVYENIETARAKNADYHISGLNQMLFDIDVYSYTCTLASTGETVASEVAIFNDKPERSADDEYVLYYHGGAFVDAPLFFHFWYVARLARQLDVTVIMPMQLMAPDYTYVQSYDQTLQFYSVLTEYVNPEQLTFMGDSSGGNYVVSLGLQLRDKGLPLPANIVAYSPWLYMATENQGILDIYNSGTDVMIVPAGAFMKGMTFAGIDIYNIGDYADVLTTLPQKLNETIGLNSPDYIYLNPYLGSLEGMPPITIFAGSYECLTADTRAYADRIESIYGDAAVQRVYDNSALGETESEDPAGVLVNYYEYYGQCHTFPIMPIPESREVNAIVGSLIRG